MTGKPEHAKDDPPILDAASIVLVDASGVEPRLLMGLRQANNAFLPSKWVFPGGRLEAGDADIAVPGDLDPGDRHALAQRLRLSAPEGLAKALAVAAVRELFEETGHALAQPVSPLNGLPSNGPWDGFARLGLLPVLEPLRFLARAITPPGRSRRYDTRFFTASRADVIEGAGAADGEFADINWFTIDEARALDLPAITRRILADLESLLANPGERGSVPFYYEEDGVYRRDLITRAPALV